MTLTIGGQQITPASSRVKRLSGLLWGSAGSGKTTLACTAPGRKLLINFDPDGQASVAGFPDLSVVDFSGPGYDVVSLFKKTNDPLGLASVIEQYDSVIVDSLTNVGYKALQVGISKSSGATVERPDPQAYQVRNSMVLQLVKNVLALTSKHEKHCIFIAHEDEPVKNKEGAVMYITLSLGGKLPEQTALDFSEVWNVQDMGVGRERRILFRPARNRKPLKTRMFNTTGDAEFTLDLDAEEFAEQGDDYEGHSLARWWREWEEGGFKKLPVPKVRKGKK